MAMLKVAVLASGSGSNFQALLDGCASGEINATIALLITNKPDCLAVQRAEKAGIPVALVPQKKLAERDAAIDELLHQYDIEFICLAGYMRLLSEKLVTDWHNKIINIHPSLLPAFKGLEVQQRVLDTGAKIAGCTVHFVRPAMDEGPIITQAAVPVLHNDTADTLGARILKQEHLCYASALKWIAAGDLTISGDTIQHKHANNVTTTLRNPQ